MWTKAFSLLSFCTIASASLPENMSLQEKVGQILMVQFHGERLTPEAESLIQDTKVGGIIYYNWANGLTSPEQVRALSKGLQAIAPIPLLIAADQEGGVVARLQNGFTEFPGNRALGATNDPTLAERAAFTMGQELQDVGVNFNLAPVVDINSNPRNPVIGIRSFGDTPETVIAYGEQALHGFHRSGIFTSLKHFPGHGDTGIDSHEDLPVITKSLDELKQTELLPFAKLHDATEAIMTAHLLVPALDPEHCTTLSEKSLRYLRETIGFKGLIISDSLLMEGVLKKCHTIDEAAIQALQAGCDMLILGGRLLVGAHTNVELTPADIQRIHDSIVKAVESGRVPESRLNNAVERILHLKSQFSPPTATSVSTPEHLHLAETIASSALHIKNNRELNLTGKTICLIAPEILRAPLLKTSYQTLGETVDLQFFDPQTSSASLLAQTNQADAIILFSYNAWKNPSVIELTNSLLSRDKPLILCCVRDPLDASLFPGAHIIFSSFSPTATSIQAIWNHLKKSPCRESSSFLKCSS